MIIKVCGMREADNIRTVEALGVDWLGFIFAPKSPRYVCERPSYLPTKCKRVGVFVDASIEDVVQHIRDYGLDLVQLHGHETPEYINELRDYITDPTPAPPLEGRGVAAHTLAVAAPLPCRGGVRGGVSIIKALNIGTAEDLRQTHAYEGHADYFLFDTKCTTMGGSGMQFDWSVLAEYHDPTPFLLSGGIGPDDAERVRAFHHERCIGIDLNSRFEAAPALKDPALLRSFLQAIK